LSEERGRKDTSKRVAKRVAKRRRKGKKKRNHLLATCAVIHIHEKLYKESW
jgi:hypothetical protein